MQTILLLKSAFLCVFRFFGLSLFDTVTTLILSRLAPFLPFFEVIPEIFYKTVQGLYNLALFRQRIGLRIVVHKQTYKRLPQFADFIYHNFPFVAQVAFMQMETTGLAKENFENLWIDPYDYNNELREAVLLLADRGMKPYIYNAQLCVLPEDIRCYAQRSISDWKDIYIEESDGCVLKGQCAGFFESNRQAHSSHIKKIEHISSDISC